MCVNVVHIAQKNRHVYVLIQCSYYSRFTLILRTYVCIALAILRGILRLSKFKKNFMKTQVVMSLILLFVTSLSVHAQEEEMRQTISLELVDDSFLENELLDDLIAPIMEQLETDDIIIVFEEGDYPNIQIKDISSEDMMLIVVSSDYPVQIANSLLLSQHYYPDRFMIPDFQSEDTNSLITGFAHYILGNYKTAIEYFRHYEGHGGAIAQFYIGNAHVALNNYQEAVYAYESALELSPTPNHATIYNLSWTYVQLNDADNAIAVFDNLLQHSFFRTRNEYARRARIYALLFDYDNAIVDINTAISWEQNFQNSPTILAYLYTIRGEIIFLIYEWDRVEENFDTAIELDPTYAPAYFQRGILFYTMARREDALADFETYLELDPDGIYAEDAQAHIESIQIEIEALGG